MDEKIYMNHYKTIKNLVENLGIDSTDDYLRQELRNITKNVVSLREKVASIKTHIGQTGNCDEITHLRYDIDDAESLLIGLLDKLRTADEKYVCFKEYIRKKQK